ncbi:MAG: haloacid dehalogenase-like hydrolase [Anaerolineae bacterium]|nr:haloacid dehalogenase-like hydrolase [Anaerolineae bacterium]
MISWRVGPLRDTLLAFIDAVTDPGDPFYVPPAERLAVFDHDGTLWCEKPLMVHIYALLARYRQLARREPLRLSRRALRAVFANDHSDFDNVFQRSEWAEILGDLAGVPFSEMSDADFEAWVRDWAEHWRHPRFGVGVRWLVYRPMVELLHLLQARAFTVAVTTADEAAFVRVLSTELYGVAPGRVLGSNFVPRGSRLDPSLLLRGYHPDFFHDGEDKPRCIERDLGRRPLLAAGNSDGDLAMLRWTAEGQGARLPLVIRHTDAAREYAYDRRAGRLLAEAAARGWPVVDMARDWEVVFGATGKGEDDGRRTTDR